MDEEKKKNDDGLQAYIKEIEILETDFSDLYDLDLEELQEMQEAIAKVKEDEEISVEEIKLDSEKKIIGVETDQRDETDYLEKQQELIRDFSDIDEIDFDELREMKQAIEIVKQEELDDLTEAKQLSSQVISKDLEDKIKQELLKRKEKVEEEIITKEKFFEYVKNKRNKIWYHALYYLVYKVEDNLASKSLLYDVLKEVTSKSAIDSIPEHQFYFGLGYILRLSLNGKKIIRYMKGGKLKVNVNINELKEILEDNGEPISTRPIIAEDEKKKMFKDFLKDDFLDI